ncbi:unnamed protein product [Caretta caretta]
MARGEKKALQSDSKALGDELTFAAIELRFSFLQRFPTSPSSQAHAVTSPVSRLAWFLRQFGCRALRCTPPPLSSLPLNLNCQKLRSRRSRSFDSTDPWKITSFEEFWLLVDLQILRDLYGAVELPLRKPECFHLLHLDFH